MCIFVQVITQDASIQVNSWNTYTIANLSAGFDSLVVIESGTRHLQFLGESFQSFDFAAYNAELFIGGHPQLGTVQVCILHWDVPTCARTYVLVCASVFTLYYTLSSWRACNGNLYHGCTASSACIQCLS